jgi:Mg2+ and Co2+ transporter CorA
MIHSLYYHGDDIPATGLELPQLQAAGADAAGGLWIDLESPSAEEMDAVLREMFAFDPLTISAWQGGTPITGLTSDEGVVYVSFSVPRESPDSSTSGSEASSQEWKHASYEQTIADLGMYVTRRCIVTVHNEPIASIEGLREYVTSDAALLAAGPDRLAAEVFRRTGSEQLSLVAVIKRALDREASAALGRRKEASLPELYRLQTAAAGLRRQQRIQAGVAKMLAEQEFAPVHEDNRVYFGAAYHALRTAEQRSSALVEQCSQLVALQLPLAAAGLQGSVRLLAVVSAALALALVAMIIVLATLGFGVI